MAIATRLLEVDSQRPDEAALQEAARVLCGGGLVAFATETVYGLGAVATDPAAVRRVFEAKGRPPANPIIVHAAGEEMARTCLREWPAEAGILSRHFWPGPLTLVLPRSDIIPDEVTAGLDTVGVRVPDHPVARALIERVGQPLAAPSANRSTGISPTLAEHVLKDLAGKVEIILDSGPTHVGLESTVVEFFERGLRILRPGVITAEMLRDVSGRDVRLIGHAQPGPLTSPGQLPVHYSPRVPTVRVDRDGLGQVAWPTRGALILVGQSPSKSLSPSGVRLYELPTPEAAARDLYRILHECESSRIELIVIVPPPDGPEWSAVRDRIGRAAREATGSVPPHLKKSAGSERIPPSPPGRGCPEGG